MPRKYKIINIIHALLLVFLLLVLSGVIVYALEGGSVMEIVCAFVTHFDGKPHTGAGVVNLIEAQNLIPICLISICILLVINKIVYRTTVVRYKKNHFIANSTKSKSARKLFKDEAPTTKVVEDKKEKIKKESRMKLKKFKEKHASTKVKDMPKELVKETEQAVSQNLEKADSVATNTTLGQLEELLKRARNK